VPSPLPGPGACLRALSPSAPSPTWQEDQSGFLEVDLVSHCGESAEGFYLTTLSAVDVASGWSECIGVWGKGQERVGAAVHRVRQRLPFSLSWLDSDNGNEFINHHLYTCCRREGITFTRSRSYKLAAMYHDLNPVSLLKQINGNLQRLWALAERPAAPQRGGSHNDSITLICEAAMPVR
jgi:hypothetical protein